MDAALRLVNVVISMDAELLHLLSLSSAVRQRGEEQLYNQGSHFWHVTYRAIVPCT